MLGGNTLWASGFGSNNQKERWYMNYLEIEKVIGREILDSRGNPTVEAEVTLVDGTRHRTERSVNRRI